MKKLHLILFALATTMLFSCQEPVPPIGTDDAGNALPICYFSAPLNGSSFFNTVEVNVQIQASDKDGEVQSVSLYIDNTLYKTIYYSPYSITLPANYLTQGSHTLKATAKDNDGGTKSSSITLYTVLDNGQTTIFSIGDYYYRNGVKGIIYKLNEDGTSGMIVSLDDTLCNWAWSSYLISTGATDPDNGSSNMNKILESGQIRKHPAFNWCNGKNKNSITGWYLPAKNQMRDLFKNIHIVADSMAVYGEPFYKVDHETDTIYLWTSTEINQNNAWGVNFLNGNCSNPNKYWHAYVRAVHPF